jgi:hypothetical protein
MFLSKEGTSLASRETGALFTQGPRRQVFSEVRIAPVQYPFPFDRGEAPQPLLLLCRGRVRAVYVVKATFLSRPLWTVAERQFATFRK